MQRIAAEVGYSETAFLAPAQGAWRTIRFFSPVAEVTFCGHATIASAVVLGHTEGEGNYRFESAAGELIIRAFRRQQIMHAAMTSVAPRYRAVEDALLDDALDAMGWRRSELDEAIPPALAYAGAWHLVLAAASSDRLGRLEYDFDRLRSIMQAANLTTLQLIWRECPSVFHARNPFPVGGVVEDPATGAAAAALGGYLRDSGLVRAPHSFLIRQGEAMGRPSQLHVEVPEQGGIVVSGAAVDLT